MERVIEIDKKGAGERIDKFLAQTYPEYPRNFFQKELEKGAVLLNGEVVLSRQKLREGDQVELKITHYPQATLELKPQPEIEVEVVAGNRDFLVINKPAGISVHPSWSEQENTLSNGLIARFPELEGVGENALRPGIVHRLDKKTSGLLLVARKQKSFLELKKIFQERKIIKRYRAICWGRIKKKGTIKGFVGRSRKYPTRQATSKYPEKLINPKQAITEIKPLESGKRTSLLEVSPRTGRKHQIRIHLHSLGHPIVGDDKYASQRVARFNRLFDRYMLHAQSLEFSFRGEDYNFNIPAPFPELAKINRKIKTLE
jgi:23S rRNA pseudouridine1911/1915/1917 synthase